MTEPSQRTIFLEAIGYESLEARAAYLDQACGGDEQLRRGVEELLSAHDSPVNLLDQPVASLAAGGVNPIDVTLPFSAAITETPGMSIGPYRLMEQIGEGGFGLVFVAEQQQPVRRKVALKIVKPGMDSREVIARFEAEQQALAMMEHPNIARVLDAGTTEAGRPFFVMELVRGVPITRFCDEHGLGLDERLELFITVCAAVQHAHQKGVIHRDIKPSNVLVTLHGEIAVPKVIDFGVAKALHQSLTDKTIYTRFTAMIGTPLYMSPEQAEMSDLDVDTRSDIYSLGVLLYELLTGVTPFARERLEAAGLDEMRRIIREEEPPRPSTRLTTIDAALSTVQDPRRRQGVARSFKIRGDLDWIVMKALEKDRRRRYDSASELADDVRRFLSEEPILARPPSQIYQLRKFASRHRAVLVTVALIGLTLVVTSTISLWMAAVAVSQRNEKDDALREAVRLREEANDAREEIAEFAQRLKEANVLVTSGRAHADAGRWAAAYADLTEATQRQPNYYNAWTERGAVSVKLGLWRRAAEDYSKAIELGVPVDNPANWGIPQLFLMNGDEASYRTYCEAMLEQAEEHDEIPSVALIRSCVVAQQGVGDVGVLAEQAVAWSLEAARQPFPFGPPPGPGPGRGGGPPGGGPPGGRPPGPPPRQGGPGFEGGAGQGPTGARRPFPRLWYPRGACEYVAGLALYRAGRYPESIELLEQAVEDNRWQAYPIVYPALAMAYHRAGDSEKAKDAFMKSQEQIDAWTATIEQSPVGALPIAWFDWIECVLLHREASVLLTGFAPADDPRLRAVQLRAEQLLQGGGVPE